MKQTGRILVVALAALALTVIPASAGDLIANGIDLWATPADGGTFVNFAADPIPADFFCTGSTPFVGKVVFKGVPIPTQPEGIFGNADTVVQRLDDAVFAGSGTATRFQQNVVGPAELPVAREIATTRVQVRALSFVSVEPIRTACGAFHVHTRLAPGDQPITQMTITREHANGGRFVAPLSLNVVLSFSPVKSPARETLEITRRVDFPGKANSFWSDEPGEGGVRHLGFAQIDTTGDGAPDTYIPGTSNFAAGWNDGQPLRPASGALATVEPEIVAVAEPTPYCDSGEVTRYGDVHCHATTTPQIEAEWEAENGGTTTTTTTSR